MCLVDFNGHMGRHSDVFDGVHGGYDIGYKNFEGRMLLKFCLWNYVHQIHYSRETKRR